MGAHSKKPSASSRFWRRSRLVISAFVLFFVFAIGIGAYLYNNTSRSTAIGSVVPGPVVTATSDPTVVHSPTPSSTKRTKVATIAPTSSAHSRES